MAASSKSRPLVSQSSKSRQRVATSKSKSRRQLNAAPSSVSTTAGEEEYEDDFEDNEEMEDDSLEAKRKKLFLRPPSSRMKQLMCGMNQRNEASELDPKDIDPADKLSIRRKTALDYLKDNIPKPEGSVPPTAFPTWFEIDMNNKIPLINAPQNYIYYSRGKLSTPLHRCHPNYMIYDQLNHERVVTAPYNPLHDPHVKNYVYSPTVKAFLTKQGFINERNEVYCSYPEFTQFRGYLSTLYNDQVNNVVSRRNCCSKFQRDQLRDVQTALSSDGGRQAFLNTRRQRAKSLQKEGKFLMMHKFESKKRQMDMQLARWRENKAKNNLAKLLVGFDRDKQNAERLYRIRFERLLMQRSYLKQSTMKEIECNERKRTDLEMMERTQEQLKINWLDSKLEACRMQMERDKQIEAALHLEQEENTKKRQRKVEWMRNNMPAQIEKKKAEERRLWDIVRKFAMRWLEKVRRRLHAPKDLQHESVWIGKSRGVMDDTLKYLKEISGYEKMDDFVLNIIKLKKQIQAQIELEEAEEAAAAAAEQNSDANASNTDKPSGEENPPNSDKQSSAKQPPSGEGEE